MTAYETAETSDRPLTSPSRCYLRKEVYFMFEELDEAADDRNAVIAPQNHPFAFVSFVWDTTAGSEEE